MTTSRGRLEDPAAVLRGLAVPSERIGAFCRRWEIAELALFGSVLRDDFHADSDVDVLVTFQPQSQWRFYHLAEMKEELEGLFGRPVDLIEKRVIERSENPIRRRQILEHAVPIYVT